MFCRIIYLFFVLARFWCNISSLSTGPAPSIPCPQIFSYIRVGKDWMGKIVLSNLPVKSLQLDVQFSQRTPTNRIGALRLYYGPNITDYNLRQGNPIEYVVEFPNPKIRPKLTYIATNGEIICSSDPYPPPTTISFTQVFEPTIKEEQTEQEPKSLSRAEKQRLHYKANPFLDFDAKPTQQPLAVTKPNTVSTEPAKSTVNTVTMRTDVHYYPIDRQNWKPKWDCGRSISPLVYKGQVPERGQLPWLTAIYEKELGSLSFFCSGSLVAPRTVLSAAHCVIQRNVSVNAIVVFPGRYDLWSYGENDVHPHELATLLIHPEYNNEVFPDADIVLLQLKTAVRSTRFVLPICLWVESDDVDFIVNKTARVAGWGSTEDGKQVSNLPRMAEARIVNEIECISSSYNNKALTSSRTICAGNRDGSGPCTGDSGTGLMINLNGSWFLRGIVSGGQTINDKCNLNEFVIYCDLAKHIKWILENIWL